MKKNKIIVGIIATICNIPISLVLASMIHIQLSKIDVPKTLYDLSKIVVNENFLPLFFLMFSLFEVLIFAMLVVNKNSFYSELDSITDKIQTPKSIGQGQHGTARWQTQREFEKNFKCNELPIYNKNNFIIRKLFKKKQKDNKKETDRGGLVVGYKKTKKTEQIYFVDDNIHSLTVGATRSGKTRSVVLQTIGNLALAGESMILSDPKRRAI
ncbi:MAG: type IV secretory system conjugative DNA transfer family protein [Bacilli bacterium]